MSCLSDGILRARFDDQLSQPQLQECEQHLASCADCRRRSEAIAHDAKRVSVVLSTLGPLPSETPSDDKIPWARFQARTPERPSVPLVNELLSRRLLPAWGALAAVCLIGITLTFAPARSWAQRILAMLRVQKITVVPMDWNALNNPANRDRLGKSIAQLVSDEVVVTIKPGQPQVVESPAQAEELAGFKVRLLGNQSEPPEIRIVGEQAFHGTVNLDRVHAILDEAGRSDLQFPASLDGATIAVHIPKIVLTQYGNCSRHRGENKADVETKSETGCINLVQAPSPTVSVPPELNMAQIAAVGLRLGGMSAEAAQRFSQTVDWTSTLVLGLPQGTSYQTVDVDGVQGTWIDQSRRGGRSRYSLLWVKNGIIYALAGSGGSTDALTLAQSLK